MAERNFNDPEQRDEYRQQLEDERSVPPGRLRAHNQGPRRPSRGTGAMWWWLLFLAVIIACIWLIPWGTRSNTGPNPNARQAVGMPMPNNANDTNNKASSKPAPPTTTVSDVTANPKSFEGTTVLLRKATVQRRLGNSVLVVGPDNSTATAQPSVIVLLPPGLSNSGLHHGSRVQITGTVAAAPANNDNLGLSNTDAEHVRQQGYYLRASAIAPTSRGENSGTGGGR